MRPNRQPQSHAYSQDRRRFLAYVTNSAVLGITGALTVNGLSGAKRMPVIKEVRIPLTGLPAAFEGYTQLLAVSLTEARRCGYDLQISGHTHGGQFIPWNILLRFFYPYRPGLHDLDGIWLYVSSGTGYWGPPLRSGADSEITRLILTGSRFTPEV